MRLKGKFFSALAAMLILAPCAAYAEAPAPDVSAGVADTKDVSAIYMPIRAPEEIVSIPLPGHSNFVRSVAFSPDGKMLASGSWNGEIIIWDVASRSMLKKLSGRSGAIWSVAFSPDGKLLASGSEDKTVTIWDAASWNAIRVLANHWASVWSIAFSPDGSMLASASSDNSVKVVAIALGRRRTLYSGRPVMSVAFSRDNKLVASGGEDGAVKLWEAATSKMMKLLLGHTAPVLSVAFSPDGKLLASGSEDNAVIIWDAATGDNIRKIGGNSGEVRSLAFSPDSKMLALGSGGATILIRDAVTGIVINSLFGHSGTVHSVAFSPDGMMLASGGGDNNVRLWVVARSYEPPPVVVVEAPKPAAAPAETAASMKAQLESIEGKFVTRGINFDVDSYRIKPESYVVIKEIADVLKEYAGVRFKIVGHTDSDASDAHNLKLSQNRAKAVREALVKKHGIEAERLETDGRGEREPVAPNTTRAGKAKNRRVEFIKL